MSSTNNSMLYAINNLQASINNLTILFYKKNTAVTYLVGSLSSINTSLLLTVTGLNLPTNYDNTIIKNIDNMVINIGDIIDAITDLLNLKYTDILNGHVFLLVGGFSNMITGLISTLIGICSLSENENDKNNFIDILSGLIQHITALTLVVVAISGIIHFVIADTGALDSEIKQKIIRIITIIEVSIANIIDTINKMIVMIKNKLPNTAHILIHHIGTSACAASTLLSLTNSMTHSFARIDNNIDTALARLLSTTNTFIGTINSINMAINT